jgi:tRNA A-37 threonylcarbamoyl transferase component Bud32
MPPDAPQGLCPKCLFAPLADPTEAGVASVRPVAPPLAAIAAAFPHLEILEIIGAGGMGSVFKARQPKLDRFVALKILPESLGQDPKFAERFAREGRLLAKLNHPNIVTIHDFGQSGGYYFLLMEFVDGVNLRQAMRASRFTATQALGIVPKICEALQYAHDEGVLHRDIKPENILLDGKGRIKLADFGIAKLTAEPEPTAPGAPVGSSTLTQAGAALGTPQYMAPEQRDTPGDVDHRADIYSLGVVFYELLTGELPTGKFSPPSARSAADPRVDAIVQQALEKERERRQRSAAEVRTQVETLGTTAAGLAPLMTAVAAADARLSRAALAGVLLIIGFLFVFFGTFVSHRAVVAHSEMTRDMSGQAEALATTWLKIMLVACAVLFPAGATILGWMGVSHIRRSAGRLYGLGLAVLDGLFFPLVILNALLGWFWWGWIGHDYFGYLMEHNLVGPGFRGYVTSKIIPGFLCMAGFLNFLIIHPTMRRVSAPLGGWPVGSPQSRWSRTGVRTLVVLLIGAVASLLWALLPLPSGGITRPLPVPEAGPPATFGPTFERVLRDVLTDANPQGLSLHTSALTSLPPSVMNSLREAGRPEWLFENDVDLAIATAGEDWMFLCFNVTFADLDRKKWDEASVSDLEDAFFRPSKHLIGGLDRRDKRVLISQEFKAPLTLAFRREQTLGILQITQLMAEPRSIRLRYKLATTP